MARAKAANPRRKNGAKRSALRKSVAAEGLPCHLCGKPIDYSLPAGHPMAYELDELVPVSKGGSPLLRSNVAPAHRICNQRRGSKDLSAVQTLKMTNPGDFTSQNIANNEKSGVDLLSLPLPLSQDW